MRKIVFFAFALAVVGCSSLLGLDDFEDAPVSSGSGGMGGVAGSGATGGAGGTAGIGGTAGMAGSDGGTTVNCTPVNGQPDELLSDVDLGAFPLEAQNIGSLVAITGTDSAHVALVVRDKMGAARLFVRSIRNAGGSYLGNLATWDPPAGTSDVRLEAGVSTPLSPIVLWGTAGDQVGRLTFQTNDQGVQSGTGKFDPLPTPPDCTQAKNGYPDKAAFSPQPSGGLKFAVTCRSQQDSKISLWVVDAQGQPPAALVTEKPIPDGGSNNFGDLEVSAYAFAGGEHLLFNEQGGVFFGKNPASLTKGQLKLTNDPVLFSIGFAALATPDQSSALILAAAVDFQQFSKGDVYVGAVKPADYPQLLETPSPVLDLAVQLKDGTEFPMLEQFAADSEKVVMAAGDRAKAAVRFWLVSRTGTVSVANQAVYTVPNANLAVDRAVGARVGADYYVAWLQSEPGPKTRLLGKAVLCTGQP